MGYGINYALAEALGDITCLWEDSCFFFFFQKNGMSQMGAVPSAGASEWVDTWNRT